MLLRAEFLSIALILVYVGAVMVLFLFVVMMLDINADTLREGFWKHAPVAGLVGLVIALEMAAVLIPGFNLRNAPMPDADDLKLGNTKLLGIEIYTEYLYPLEIAAVLLLVAIIAAIALGQIPPLGLIPALALMLVGVVMVIRSGSRAAVTETSPI
jgi:NADH-quinone oxidoreductase subunit J